MIPHKLKTVLEQKKPIRFLFSKLIQKTALWKLSPLMIKRDGYRLRFFPTSLSASLWTYPTERHDDEVIIKSLLRPGDIFIDVGANVGTHSLAAATVVGNGHVYAVEAHPVTFQYLKKNIELNTFSNITLYNYAVGNSEGTISFSNLSSDDMNHVSTSGGGSSVVVPLKKLDELITARTPIRLMKVDVEGYEKMVFEGARELLKNVEYVFFESCEDHFMQYDYTTGDVIAVLNALGFSCYKIDKSNSRTPIDKSYKSAVNENLLAIRTRL